MVQTNQYQDAPANVPDPWAIAQGRSIPSFSFNQKDQYGQNVSLPVGTTYTGVLKENLSTQQQRDFVSGELAFWDDGKPKWQIAAVFNTQYREQGEEEDDGTRRFFFSNQSMRALQDEMRAKNIKRFGVGTQVTITLTGLKPTQKGFPQKLYEVKLENVQPWTDDEAVQAALGQGEQWHQETPAAPQQPQVAAQQPQAPAQQAPQQPQAPAQPQQAVTQPAAPQGIDPALLAAAQAAQAQIATPAAPASRVTPELLQQVEMLKGAGIAPEAAIQAVASKAFPNDASFLKELTELVPF